MDKYPKTDLEFEALFESVYRRKVDASQLHELQKKQLLIRLGQKVMVRVFKIKVLRTL